jgi:signal transduction histidine kinase
MKDEQEKKRIHTINPLKKLIVKERKHRSSLTMLFSAVAFLILLSALGLAWLAAWLITKYTMLGNPLEEPSVIMTTALVSGISIVIGTAVSFLFVKFPLKPINTLINHMNRLASGDFKTRLKFEGMISDHPTFNEISDSFNKLAEELENTEVLRSDFINNFSHEFKTPIVSIAGLAKLVNKGKLSAEEQSNYLTAIEKESLRLATMATNVLQLTKVENQTILTDLSTFNLSEQIRSCVLLLENKWEKKQTVLSLEFDEYTVTANEELLRQVWINLVDNAVKFSPNGGCVSVEIEQVASSLLVSVRNTGSEISKETQKKIWNKFYQADESHAGEGNGIGLAIVKRIVDLHSGSVAVESGDGLVTFTVEIPIRA